MVDCLDLAVVGSGRLALALADALTTRVRGHRLLGFYARNKEALASLLQEFPDSRSLDTSELAQVDVLFLAVADDAIEDVAGELAKAAVCPGLILHASGAHGTSVFQPFIDRTPRKTKVGVLHPLVSLSSETGLEAVPMILCGDDRDGICAVARSLGAEPIWTPELERPLYHAAATMLANGLTALFAAGRELLELASAKELGAKEALLLMRSALLPLQSTSAEAALTGPVRRGDHRVIEGHRKAIARRAPSLLTLYDALAEHSIVIAQQGGLTRSAADELRRILKEDVLKEDVLKEEGEQA